MRTQVLFRTLLTTIAAVVIGSFGLAAGVYAAPGGGGGGGGGDSSSTDLGDLFILYRDDFGIPVLTEENNAGEDTGLCQQPIAFPSDTCTIDETFGCAKYADDGVTCVTYLVPVDQATCAVTVGGCTGEVDFGRTNSIRSPDTVLDSQLDDVLVNLATADCIGLDPAGRLVASTVEATEDGTEVYNGTIDSPLQSLAIYKQLMLTGSLGVPLPDNIDIMNTAARGFGTASDKGGKVGVDMLVYANEILGLTDPNAGTILGAPECIDVREEVAGNIQLVQKCFLNYGNYTYERGLNFLELPAPPYVPEIGPTPGWFEYLWGDGTNFTIVQGPIMDAVFCSETIGSDGFCPGLIYDGFTEGNIGGFAQAADDTRAVIDYMHTWPIPADFVTPMVCDVDPGEPGDGVYDLAISEESGFQVPSQVVATTEGREFIVNVAYAAGDTPATGFVRVTADTAAGGPVLVDGVGGPFVFEFSDIGQQGFSTGVVMFTIGEPHVTTKINWTAEVVAEGDLNPNNNVVTATSNVRVTGGGRR